MSASADSGDGRGVVRLAFVFGVLGVVQLIPLVSPVAAISLALVAKGEEDLAPHDLRRAEQAILLGKVGCAITALLFAVFIVSRALS